MNSLSHNLVGQRLGKKGRDTRERILAATDRLLAGPPDTAISLSAVAREASLAMTTLYIYFNDLTELLLAVLDPCPGPGGGRLYRSSARTLAG
jgi:AcrR family transcriptional regulator